MLLVYGAESWQLAWADPDEVVTVFPDARAEVVEGAGHWVQHDQLDVFVDMVRSFLAD